MNTANMLNQTNQVLNQPPPLVDYDMFSTDHVLVELMKRYGAGWATDNLTRFGRFTGSAEAIALAVQANTYAPVLHTHDRYGKRIDEVEFHPAWHRIMQQSIAHGMHNLPWTDPRQGAHVARAALMYLAFQNEAGHCCPVSMTFSVMPVLARQPDLTAPWQALILSNSYDPAFAPASQKKGVLIGMGMTERQGGSDVRANTTFAVPAGQPGAGKEYLLTGHKWFCSAPMCDAFLILAQTEGGLSCFLLPRWKPDGTKNNFFIQRLKDKLGNRSNASSEVEFVQASGWLIGEEGRGVANIIEMVNHTRLDCSLGAAALMRQTTLQALHHAHHRQAFGRKLSEQPLMLNVLADLALESEAALRMVMRLARAYDTAASSEAEAQFRRIASAITKYWLCKRVPMHVAEALECLGGNGYVEDSHMPRFLRESPLLGIWEGSGNVICLDVLRAVARDPQTLDAFVHQLELAHGRSIHLDRLVSAITRQIEQLKMTPRSKRAQAKFAEKRERTGRRLVEQLAIALQAALMVEQAPACIADAFIASRVRRDSGLAFGTLPASVDVRAIVARAYDGVLPV